MRETKKLDFLDGLKVFSCLLVFEFHFFTFFYPGIYCLMPEYYHVPAVEHLLGTTPLNLIFNGKYTVRIFMALSGFFVGYRYFITGNKDSLKSGIVKKYFRLILPIVFTNIMIYILMKLSLYQNCEASVLANSEIFYGGYNSFAPNLGDALKEALFGCFINGANQYNGPLWFIFYEFFGTIMISVIVLLVGDKKWRYVVYAVAALIFVRSDFLSMILGMVVCDLTYREPKWLSKFSSNRWLVGLLLAGCLFLCSFPAVGERYEGTIYQYFPIKVMFYYNVAAPLIIYAILHLKTIPKVLAVKPLTRLSKYTYCFYLIHFPIICTVSCGLFIACYDKMNYHLLVLLDAVLTFIITVLLSMTMYKFIELPGIKMANKVVELLENTKNKNE